MGSRRAQRSTILRAGIATLLLGTTLAVTGIAISPASAYEPDPENHKIEICHATGSEDNPYTTPSPAKWQITSPNGHGYLPADGSHDADIIPPFPAGEHGGQSWPEYLGQNWTEENEAFYDAHCGEPESGPQTGDVTLAKVLAGGDAIPDPAPTGFDFTVECDSGTVADPVPAIVPGAAAVIVADDVELDDTCTITETGVPLNAGVTFSTGEPGIDSTTVTVGSTNGVAVTATNTYTSNSGGQTADVTLRKVLAGDAVPSPEPTGFDFTVSCADSGVVPDAAPTVAPDAAALTVATGVEVGDTCTITETTVLPAGAAVSYDQGTEGPSSTTVTVDADGVAVVATNTYNSSGCTVDCGGPNPTAVLSASRSCATGGILIAVSNAGDAAGAVNILSGMDQPFSHGLNVLAGDSDEVLVPIAEDSDYLITVTDAAGSEVATFRGPKDCVTVGGIVVRPPAAAPAPVVAPVDPTPVVQPVVARPVEVAGVVQTRELPRTGVDSLPLAQLGAALVLLGAAFLVGSRRLQLA